MVYAHWILLVSICTFADSLIILILAAFHDRDILLRMPVSTAEAYFAVIFCIAESGDAIDRNCVVAI